MLPILPDPAGKGGDTNIGALHAPEHAADLSQQLSALNMSRDSLLVDQRGTGGSTLYRGDVTQYGTRMAMDDSRSGAASERSLRRLLYR